MEMNLICYGLIVALCLFGIHEFVSIMFYAWMALNMKLLHKAALKVVQTRWFQDHYYLDEDDEN